MENAGEEDCSEANRVVVKCIKSAIDDIKQLNGLVDKDTTKHNGQFPDLLKKNENDSEGLEPNNDCKDYKYDQIGNGDRSLSTESVLKDSEMLEDSDTCMLKDSEIVNDPEIVNMEVNNDIKIEETVLLELDSDENSQVKSPKPKVETGDVAKDDSAEVSDSDISDIKTKLDIGEQTPVKLESVKSEKFILNDKIRNSLKDLADKVKSTPEKRTFEMDRNNHNGISSTELEADIVEIPSEDSNVEESSHVLESDKENSKQSDSNESDKDADNCDIDDTLLDSTASEDTQMDIGSDDDGNEDDLLEITKESTNGLNKKCNNIKNNLTIFHDKVQFDEDSNSNSNTGKINEIVNFLNTDLSNSKSPLTVENGKEKEKDADQSHITIIDDDTPMETEGIQNDDKRVQGSKNVEDNGASVDTNGDLCSEDSEKQQNSGTKDTCSTTDITDNLSSDRNDSDDDVIICESQTKEEDVHLKSESQNGIEALDKHETKTENEKMIESSVEEDDDVIFEKEVKASDNSNCKKLNCDTKQNLAEPSISKGDIDKLERKQVESEREPSLPQDKLTGKNSLVEGNESNIQSADRKRPAENDSDGTEAESKRSRLDLSGLIGKLGSRVHSTSIELSDSEEETETGSHVTEKESIDSDEIEPKKDDSDMESKNYIRVTEKELEDLVREKVKAYLATQRNTLVVQLSQKVKDLQESNDLWKRQVKDLQSKVNEVTVLQQNLEQRKAKTDALRQITTRSVGLQVEDGRTSSGMHSVLKERLNSKAYAQVVTTKSGCPVQLRTTVSSKLSAKQESKSSPTSVKPPAIYASTPVVTAPPGSNGTIRLPIPQTSQPVLTQQIPQAQLGAAFKPPTVKSLLDTTRIQPTVSSGGITPTTTTTTSVINLVQIPPRLITQNNVSQGYITISQSNISQPITKVVSKSASVGTVTTIDLTDDDDASKRRLVTLPPGVLASSPQMTGVRHVIHPGTQIIRSGMPNSQTQYQLVFNSNSPSLRPVMTGMSSIPPSGAILQALPQSNVVTLTSPTALAPGTAVTRVAAPVVRIPSPSQPQPTVVQQKVIEAVPSHPAVFPPLPLSQNSVNPKLLPPKPSLKISRVSQVPSKQDNERLQEIKSDSVGLQQQDSPEESIVKLKEKIQFPKRTSKPKRPDRFCVYCKKVVANGKLKRHIERNHRHLPEVKNVLKQHKHVQYKFFNAKRKEGIYQYNYELISDEKEPEMRERTPIHADKVRFCAECHGFFSNKSFYKHKCVQSNPLAIEPNLLKNSTAQNMHDDKDFQDILNRFRDGEVGDLLRENCTIKMIGYKHFNKRRHEEDKENEIRKAVMYDMRELARLYLMFKNVSGEKEVEDMFKRENVQDLADTIQRMVAKGKNQEKLGLKLGLNTVILRSVKTLRIHYYEVKDIEKCKDLKLFLIAYKHKSSELFSKAGHACVKQSQGKSRCPVYPPDETDLRILQDYITHNIERITSKFELQHYKELRTLTVARLTLFNARRGEEAQRMLLNEWKAADENVILPFIEVENVDDKAEIFLFEKFKLCYIAGKGIKFVPVLVPCDIIPALRILIQHRTSYGISEYNNFVFATKSTCRQTQPHCSGWRALTEVGKMAGIQMAITDTKMRHKLSAIYASLDMAPAQRQMFLNQMGYEETITESGYQHPAGGAAVKVMDRLQEVDQGTQADPSIDSTSCQARKKPTLESADLGEDITDPGSCKKQKLKSGIVLSWNMTLQDSKSEIASYQLFAYQETSSAPSASLWKKVGDVKALPLPMACTLTQFQVGHKYHFAVRAMDSSSRVGNFSDPSSIHLTALPSTTTS